MRKFKIGDNVLIRTDLVKSVFYKNENGQETVWFAKEMEEYKGKILKIIGISWTGGGFICSYKGEVLRWTFVSEMFDDVWE